MEARGKRTAGSVMKRVASHAFGALGVRRLTGGSYAPHLGIAFVYKLLGFRVEGTHKSSYVLKPGEYADGFRWGILAEEWKAKHGA